MTGFLLDSLGRFMAALPLGLSECFCKLLGDAIYFGLPKRRRALLSNLHHAFPDKPRQWHRRIGRISCRRTVEMGFYVLASPAFSLERLKRHFTLDESLRNEVAHALAEHESGVVMVPHFSLMEALTALPGLYGEDILRVGVIFRPLNQPGLDGWVKRTRERFGLKLLSRKDGFGAAMQLMDDKGIVAVLFDQNAGNSGVLTTFFDQVASTTDLPGLLAQRRKTRAGILYTERTGFLRGRIRFHILPCEPKAIDNMIAANQWLENKLRESDDICADWLWMHSRWRTQDNVDRRFRLSARRDALEETMAAYGWDALPRKTRYWIRLPNWLGDVIMALPLLHALRLSRPDAELTLLARPHFLPLLERFGLGDRLLALPPKGRRGYFKPFRLWSEEYPDVQVLFTNSTRGDLEARCIGAKQRFGIARPGKPRRNLTHTWPLPPDLDEATVHQTRLWEMFFRHFGLEGELDLTPFTWEKSADATSSDSAASAPTTTPGDGTSAPSPAAPRIGLIPGTENSPEKRWPAGHWRTLVTALLEALPTARVSTFGTERDVPITREVTRDFDPARVTDRAGKTALVEFADELAQLDLLICNDTGGMHLANALGVPVLVIFGPTNPVRTGPVFNGPARLLQPEGCPPTGGLPIEQVHPDTVLRHARELLG
ncbi:MAG: glycosyltransferase family 9 protein [Verrucomicrobiota bacterium JB024]|nr:glycosyltransferase family 9 protein [Verrucomicrobiota bacterium JB024]